MPECFFKFPQHAAKIHRCGLAPGDDIHVHCRQRVPVVPEYFSDEPLDPVAGHGAADFFAYRNPEPWPHQFVGPPHKEEALDRIRVRCRGKPDELGPLPQSC